MKLFDLHCDTATRIYYEKASLLHNDFHISLEKTAAYEKYIQLTAVFTSTSLSDSEGYSMFWKVRENLLREAEQNGVEMIDSKSSLEHFLSSASHSGFILTVEDARILEGKTERVRELYDAGVRVITPLWGGNTVIGGSHDTHNGLTDFGRNAVCEMTSLGIIPDISHSSFESADEILTICENSGKAPIASHSDSYSVNPHSRNLTDDRLKRLVSLGGIVGTNLCRIHVSEDSDNCDVQHVLDHIDRFSSLAPSSVALGCDLDGTDLPDGINDVSSLPVIAAGLRERGYSDDAVDSIFFNTAYDFMKNNLPE